MLNELIEKRKALIAEFDAIKKKSVDEKRTAYTNDERTRVNEIKIELSDLDERIADEKTIEEKRNAKLDLIQVSAPNITKSVSQDEFRNFLSGNGGKFSMPISELETRATVTTATNAQFVYTNQNSPVSIDEQELVLQQLGAQLAFFNEGGNVDYPSMSAIIGTFGTEDNTIADQAITSAKKTLVPTFVSASIEVSKAFIAQSKGANIESLKNALVYGVKKAIEKRAIDSMSALAAAPSGTTAGLNFLGAVVNQEAQVNGLGTGYIFSKSGVERAKKTKRDSGSGKFIWEDGMVNGYPAKRSSLQTNAGHAYFGDFRSVVMGIFGDIQIEMITDATLGRKGNVLLIASALADGTYTDANKISVLKNVLTLI